MPLTRPRRERTQPMCLILLYHRIGGDGNDPLGLSVSAERFAEHVQLIAGRFKPLALSTLVQRLRDGTAIERAVCVTFDDGYSGIVDHALEPLARHGVPATMFVPAGSVGSKREFWWDELEALLLGTPDPPAAIDLELGGRRRRWSLSERIRRPLIRGRQYRLSDRERAYYGIVRALMGAPADERERVVAEVAAAVGVERPTRRSRMPLETSELESLARAEGCEVGAHTVSHRRLAVLDDTERRQEIGPDRRTLEELSGKPVTSFAYPYGGPKDYGRQDVAAVREAGYESACANVQDAVRADASIFELPRLIVHDWDRATFAEQLEQWSSADGRG